MVEGMRIGRKKGGLASWLTAGINYKQTMPRLRSHGHPCWRRMFGLGQ